MFWGDFEFWKSASGTFRKEWQRVKYVRRAFISSLLIGWGLGGLIIYLIVSGVFETRIANKDSTIENLQTRVDGYESKLDVSTPEEAGKKIKNLESQVERLQSISAPRLKILESLFVQENEKWTYRVKIEVASRFTPNGLLLKFENEHISGDPEIQALNDPLMVEGPYEKGEDHISRYIQKPFGQFLVTLPIGSRSEVTFSWAFDDYPGGSFVAR